LRGAGRCWLGLAAGAGGPKALRTDSDGASWLLRSIAVLRDGGCSSVVVVLGLLARATFDGRPGHPVLIGASHVPAIMGGLTADRGAQGYLVRLGATGVECGDLASGEDRDQ
jgi:hypothetical protein